MRPRTSSWASRQSASPGAGRCTCLFRRGRIPSKARPRSSVARTRPWPRAATGRIAGGSTTVLIGSSTTRPMPLLSQYVTMLCRQQGCGVPPWEQGWRNTATADRRSPCSDAVAPKHHLQPRLEGPEHLMRSKHCLSASRPPCGQARRRQGNRVPRTQGRRSETDRGRHGK